jgi:hypothetical protein
MPAISVGTESPVAAWPSEGSAPVHSGAIPVKNDERRDSGSLVGWFVRWFAASASRWAGHRIGVLRTLMERAE